MLADSMDYMSGSRNQRFDVVTQLHGPRSCSLHPTDAFHCFLFYPLYGSCFFVVLLVFLQIFVLCGKSFTVL